MRGYSMWLYGMSALFLSSMMYAEPYILCASRIITLFHDYYPRCPEVCMHELAQAESQDADQDGSRKFVYRPCIAWDDNSFFRPFTDRTLDLDEWIKNVGLDKYEAYFIALAKSEKLSDEQKISDQFCQIPPITDLYAQTQAKREELFEQLWWKVGSDDKYPLRRIFAALLYRSGIRLEKKYAGINTPLGDALLCDDISLAAQLLKQGVNVGGANHCTIESAKSLAMIRLLISYGADVEQQRKMHCSPLFYVCEGDCDLFSI